MSKHIELATPCPNCQSRLTLSVRRTPLIQLKGTSSLRLFAMHPELKSQYWKRKGERSLWSPSYFVESIGSVSERVVAKYIDDQRSKERESQ